MIKVSDYIADFISQKKVDSIFTVSGAGDLHIIDSIRRHPKLNYICNHHEQASAMAAYSYSRATQNFGICVVTTGPGATNAITGMIDFWVDSVPGLIISGQVQRKYLVGDSKIRQIGIQEINIIDLVKPISKYAEIVDSPNKIKWYLEKAYYEACSGRPGPSWLDIPIDVQSALVNEDDLIGFNPPLENNRSIIDYQKIVNMLMVSSRPVILIGHGVKAAKATKLLPLLLDELELPVCVSWNAIDLVPTKHKLYAGRFGIYGQRGANFTVQNSDLFISIGSRLNITQTGYEYSEFAREAKKVYIDIDENEFKKFPIQPEIALVHDAKEFIVGFLDYLRCTNYHKKKPNIENWISQVSKWNAQYPVNLPEYYQTENYVNSFTLIDELTKNIEENEVIIPTASGSGFTSFHQAANIKSNQIVFTSNGFAEMGFDIPGAIGAAIATKKIVWQMTGDGGIQMNIQELQTLVHYKLPVKIFIHSNNGYLTIRHTQNNLFQGRYTGSDFESGISLPSFEKLCSAYGVYYCKVSNASEISNIIQKMREIDGPCVCEVIMDPMQPLVPKISFKQLPNGKIVSPPLEDLFPFLDREEFLSNMIIPTIDSE